MAPPYDEHNSDCALSPLRDNRFLLRCGGTRRDREAGRGGEGRGGEAGRSVPRFATIGNDSSRARKWAHDIPTIHDFNGHYGDAACPLCREIAIFTPLDTLGVEINRLAFAAKLPSH